MKNPIIIIALLFVDGLSVVSAWFFIYKIRTESEFFATPLPLEVLKPTIILVLFWWVLSWLRGMYRTPVALSRFDESVRVFKTTVLGVLIIYIATYDASEPVRVSRLILVTYGLTIFSVSAFFRIIIRSYQRHLRVKGIGLWNAVIVGWSGAGQDLYRQLTLFPVWGFRIIGLIDDQEPKNDAERVEESRVLTTGSSDQVIRFADTLGHLDELPEIIKKHNIDWVLVAPEEQANETILDIFDRCALEKVRLMIIASYYQMVLGLVQSVEIHGLPLVEVATQFVSLPVRIVKRTMDLLVSLIWLVILALITPLIALFIKLDSPGPIFYKQKRVGRNEREFDIFKFRSMVSDAERKSGEVWAVKNDPRVTRVGNVLRRTHLDEIPQFINVLKGEMSLVGPRPERKKFVDDFKSRIPLYGRRLLIRPGITGWAQVRHKYDETFEDVKEKTRYDLFYMNHISIALDFKILLLTVVEVLRRKGHS